jgi:hypothetical protein
MITRFPRGLAYGISTFALVSSGHTQPRKEDAKQLYRTALESFSAKRYCEAASRFSAAARLLPKGKVVFTAAKSWELCDDGNLPRVADAYAHALSFSDLESADRREAESKLHSLEQTLGTLSVDAQTAHRIQLDTNEELSAPVRIHASAGVHTLRTRGADAEAWESTEITLEFGKEVTLTLPLPLSKKPLATRTSQEAQTGTLAPLAPPSAFLPKSALTSAGAVRPIIGWSLVGAGVLAGGATAFFGLRTNSAADEHDRALTRASYDRARGLQASTNTLVIVTGALLVAGVVTLVWPAARREIAWLAGTHGF